MVYDLLGTNVNATAYADDLVLIASSTVGMQTTLTSVEDGLLFNPQKCFALSIVPAGTVKKIVTTPQFELINDTFLKQFGPCDKFVNLGINLTPKGVCTAGGELTRKLERISKAPFHHTRIETVSIRPSGGGRIRQIPDRPWQSMTAHGQTELPATRGRKASFSALLNHVTIFSS